jgi:hypothetical protein
VVDAYFGNGKFEADKILKVSSAHQDNMKNSELFCLRKGNKGVIMRALPQMT